MQWRNEWNSITHLALPILLICVRLEQIYPAVENEDQVIDIPLYDIIDFNTSGNNPYNWGSLKVTFSNRWHYIHNYIIMDVAETVGLHLQ